MGNTPASTSVDKTPRASETRAADTRRKPWEPPSVLEAPPPPPGYKHRWIRLEIAGAADKTNVYKRLREGFEFVRADEYPGFPVPTIQDGEHAGIIGSGGLALARIPLETVAERTAYFRGQTRDQMVAVDRSLMKEQHPSMPIHNDRRTEVSFGGSRSDPPE